MIYFCTDPDNSHGAGNTLEAAYKNYREEQGDNYQIEELHFWEATLIEVEMKIMPKEIPVKKK